MSACRGGVCGLLLACAPAPPDALQAPLASWAISANSSGDLYALGIEGVLVSRDGATWEVLARAFGSTNHLFAIEGGVLSWTQGKGLWFVDEPSGSRTKVSKVEDVAGACAGERTIIWGSRSDECATFPGGMGIVQSSEDGLHWRTDVLVNDGDVRALSVGTGGRVWILTSNGSLYRSELLPDGGVEAPTRIGSLMSLARGGIGEKLVLANPEPGVVWISSWSHYGGSSTMRSQDDGETWATSRSEEAPVAAHYWRGSRRVFIDSSSTECSIRVWQDGAPVEIARLPVPYSAATVYGDQLYMLSYSNLHKETELWQVDLQPSASRE